ncbi:MAG: hypothetical protein PHX87_05175 [Candidatus Peribacteraceae bacterium]|nr:hypothetical protein [Candidatus Peribacteraceae bacterium]MDD5742788.1 hypothetical protein [Candidatus Peribacteraceae bacterium]
MSEVVFRERESEAGKLIGNKQVICPKCGGAMKRKRAKSHLCVRNGNVVLVNGSLQFADPS